MRRSDGHLDHPPAAPFAAGGGPAGGLTCTQYIIKRLLLMIPTLFGAAVLVFFLMRLIPGDICELRLAGSGGYFDENALKICQHEIGIDQPIIVQFGHYSSGARHFRPRQLDVDRPADHRRRSACASNCR